MDSPSVCRGQSPFSWQEGRRCCVVFSPLLHACLNDADANFCQVCRVPTAPLLPAVPLGRGPVDEKVIQERFQERRPYQRQKSALQQQLSTFLTSVSPPKTISSCMVDDVIKFLIYKDLSGRTVVHVPTCPGGACACPRRLAAGWPLAPLTPCLESSGPSLINLVPSTTLILSRILASRNT